MNRNFSTGGLAYGMPRNDLYRFEFRKVLLIRPCTIPVFVLTTVTSFWV